MRIIFAGTPDFAARALERLIEDGHDIVLTLTQPDRPSGRGMKLKPSPVKMLAEKHGIPVATPETLSLKKAQEDTIAMVRRLEALEADVLIVAAYGLLLPQCVLDCTKGIGVNREIRALNIHASLLPRWRGAAPIARAIEAGDAETGVTLMKMEKGLDTGPMIETCSTPIFERDTSESLTIRLAQIGAELTSRALRRADVLTCTPQPEEGVTYANKLQKSESAIDWNWTAEAFERRLRAFTPFPGLCFERDGMHIKVWEARVDPSAPAGEPGEVVSTTGALVIRCASGAVACTQLQKPGKPRMPAASFLQSVRFTNGEILR